MLDLANLSPLVQELLRAPRLPELGPGQPDVAAIARIQAASLDELFAPHVIRRRDFALACQSGLLLHFDGLDASHTLSQDLSSNEGSYWHGIMHRREPDASNAKYWFRRVGNHPVLARLADETPALGYRYTNPFDFIDFCERVRDEESADMELARGVQWLEWQLLFEHCFRQALGEQNVG